APQRLIHRHPAGRMERVGRGVQDPHHQRKAGRYETVPNAPGLRCPCHADEGRQGVPGGQIIRGRDHVPEVYLRRPMELTLRQYDAVIAECLDLFRRKAQDYGTAWRILRVSSLTDQIMIKAQRIRTLQQVGESKVGEGIRPELIGIINYAAMALVQLELGVVDTPDISADEAVERVKERMMEARRLMERKNHDYGEAWRSMRVGSLVDLILMKLLRVKQI